MVNPVIKLSDMQKQMEDKAIATGRIALQQCNNPEVNIGFFYSKYHHL